ncbi:R3H-associated N-terminal domain-containing protein [Annulohypoxylon maeteangense]|uniref:R3H-associated N-terminal domain-containing protein n=1 Tax=Annulohypoxylon maeteangense TaxID=1927788 RepID=UPI002007FD8E|nr:R3H-associated N-terminal domain-containing protein [Annulohypoxylon maeteangense]KAI0889751.1 R3H-associated N-terminal domain-containing protein [Annulohypoxylon maeteangense]
MAIYSAVPPPPELIATATDSNQQQQPQQESHQSPTSTLPFTSPSPGVDIEAWTVSALESLSISGIARGTGTPLSIPLDEESLKKSSVTIQDPRAKSTAITPPPRPLSRRDSQKRREALLKGKEGSRQRRRWENDRLIHVPNVQPPEPWDWEPRPLYPVNHIPYQIAVAWDKRVRAEVEEKRASAARRKQIQTRTLGDEHVTGRVPKELFQRAKKTPAVKTWVRSLEEPVRQYLVDQELAKKPTSSNGEDDTEDEEIVFVGRDGSMQEGWKKARRENQGKTEDEGMIFDALGNDADSAFRRWITHSISDYYGLNSRSVLIGSPKRKVVYVQMKTGHSPPVQADLPRPLWELC